MAGGVEVDISALSELGQRLGSLTDVVRGQVLQDAIRGAALPVENDAKINAPWVTGTLRRSIHTETGGDANSAWADVGTNVPYARRLELGFVGVDRLGRHYNQQPRPYLRPALDKNAPELGKTAIAVLRAAIEGVL